MIFTISVISLIIIGFYSVLIIIFALAFVTKKNEINAIPEKSSNVSIIVAFRNEAKNLAVLIDSLLKQNSKGKFEIILINDHSEDNSLEILSNYKDSRIKLYNLPNAINGKKAALRYAITKAEWETLLFTDADCLLKENWIETMLKKLVSEKFSMVCGPVEFKKSKSIFSSLFQLEFMSLTGSGAAGILLKQPFICNGANYAVTKSVLNEALKSVNDKYSSGDDVFLVHYVSRKHQVGFVKSDEAVVETLPPQSLSDFFNQRLRWASKTSGYRNYFALFVALITFLASVSIIYNGITAIFCTDVVILFLISLIIKTLSELILMIPVCGFYKKCNLLLWILVLSVLHPFYIVITAVVSQLYKPIWKGRKIK
ncbi:MAG TPA: glycosyltransferase [Bacteroidales bacterium]|nr:glycosyltransferase [Bacteroidales bacterium]